jgi:drug/metabolite transporter (DMT)-like permease
MALSNNVKGALYMMMAMATFTCNDALVKSLTPVMNTGQIIFLRGLLTTVLLLLLAWRLKALRHPRVMLQPALIGRTVFDALATVAYLLALRDMPIANTSSILQSLPLAVTFGAAIFLHEPVGWRRWSAILVGFLGVLVVLRPGPEGYGLSAIFVVLTVLFAAGRDLTTKLVHADTPSTTVSAYSCAIITFVGAALIEPLGGWQPVSGHSWAVLAETSVLVLGGYQGIVMAMRTAEISFIAPFRYTSLLWAILMGYLLFADVPDVWMLVGAAIVIGSGLYTFYRENKTRSRTAVSQRASVGPNPWKVRP